MLWTFTSICPDWPCSSGDGWMSSAVTERSLYVDDEPPPPPTGGHEPADCPLSPEPDAPEPEADLLRSYTNTSRALLVSPSTRSLAVETNAIRVPSEDITGAVLVPIPETPHGLCEICSVAPAVRPRPMTC